MPASENLLESIRAAVERWNALESDDDRFDVDGQRPRIVCEPQTPEEVAAILGVAHQERAAVIPWGAGTRMSVGFPPRAADIALVTTQLDQVVEYEPADLTVTVQAGMPFQALQTLLREHGQMLALDPPSGEQATIGGVVASAVSGPMRLLYGTPRDLVIGTRVANAEGVLTKAGGRVVKNVSGYDLNKLYAGSYGTLGVIVELSFKLHPLPQRRGSMLAVFSSATEGQAAVQRIVKSPLGPAAVDLLDQTAAATMGLPVPVGGVALVAMAAGFERAVERQTRDMLALCEGSQEGCVLEPEVGDRLWESIRRFSDLTSEPLDAMLKLNVPPARSAEAVDTIGKLAHETGLKSSRLSHAGTGVAFARLRPGGEWDAESHAALASVVTDGRSWAQSLRGSLVVERCPTELKKSIDVWGDVGSSFRIMAALKQRFDPGGILNPGRFVGHL